MTNKIKPFCVDTKAENLSDVQIKQLHKWCVDGGGEGFDDENNWLLDKNGYIIKFQDVPSHLRLTEEVDSEENITVEKSVSTPDNFYTKLGTLLTLYPITLSKGDKEAPVDIIITHNDFEHDFIVKNEEELLELVEAFDILDKLSGNNYD